MLHLHQSMVLTDWQFGNSGCEGQKGSDFRVKSVIKRILGTIPVLIGVVLLIFIMLRIVPGNAAAMLLGEHVDQATIDRLTEVMGLDKPVIVQFFDYLAGAIHGDLGISYKYNRAVTDMIMEAFPYTLELALLAALFAWCWALAPVL